MEWRGPNSRGATQGPSQLGGVPMCVRSRFIHAGLTANGVGSIGVIAFIVACLACSGCDLFSPRLRAVPTVRLKEERIGPWYPLERDAVWSEDGRHLAYVSREPDGEFVVLDGARGACFERIETGSLVLSPDATTVGYVAERGAEMHAVIGGHVGPACAAIKESGIVFSSDSRRHAYVVVEGDVEYAMVDGDPKDLYERVTEPVFHPDGTEVAYVGRLDGRDHLVVDDQVRSVHDTIVTGSVVYSATGILAYAALHGGRAFVVVDGNRSRSHDAVGGPVFSPDGRRLAYVATEGEQQFLIVDGKADAGHDQIVDGSFVFSPDSRHHAYVATSMGYPSSQYVVRDGQPMRRCVAAGGSGLVYSPDSRSLAYVAVDERAMPFVVVDDQRGPGFRRIYGPPAFSDDSAHVFFVAGSKRERYLLIDAAEAQPLPRDTRGRPVVSPNRRAFAYVQRVGDQEFVRLLDEYGPSCSWIGQPVFSEDGSRLTYLAAREGSLVRFEQSVAQRLFDPGRRLPNGPLRPGFRPFPREVRQR